MKKFHLENGRTLLETLAVLVLIGLLSISGMLGYSFLHKYLKRQETIKQIEMLAMNYRATPVKPDKDGYVSIQAVYPSANRVDVTEMRLGDSGTASLQLLDATTTSFAIVVNNIDEDTCEEYLKKGSYDAVRDPTVNKTNTHDIDKNPSIVGKTTLNAAEKEELEKLIKNICGEKESSRMYWFGNCPQKGWSYWHTDKQCHRCAYGIHEDRYGHCCSTDIEKKTYEDCGVCNCPSGYCDSKKIDSAATDTKQCVECYKDEHCGGDRPFCDREHHVCVACKEDADCKSACLECSNYTCVQGCDKRDGWTKWWKKGSTGCTCNKFLAEGAECPLNPTCGLSDCCLAGLECKNVDGKGYCCPTEGDTVSCPEGTCCRLKGSGVCGGQELEYADFVAITNSVLDTGDCICKPRVDYYCALNQTLYTNATLVSGNKRKIASGTKVTGVATKPDALTCIAPPVDCAGVCGGTATDVGCGCGVALTAEGCCPGQVKDCTGVCGGTTTYDCAGTCGGTATYDCAGTCGGTATYDCAGVCGGTTQVDCAGICGGATTYDCAGVCGGTAVDVGCGCGNPCPQTCTTNNDCTIPCQTCCGGKCVYGGTANGTRYGNQACYNFQKIVNGKVVLFYQGLQDCWECTAQQGSMIKTCKNLVNNETFNSLNPQQVYVGGCLMDPRKTWQ